MSGNFDFMPHGWLPDTPPRSVLVNVAPAGINGRTREDLRSFYRRTSVEHDIHPWTLARAIVLPAGRTLGVMSDTHREEQYSNVEIAGVGSQARAWSQTLNKLMKRSDLHLLTLLDVRRFLPKYKLSAQVTQYCPQCYADDERLERPVYDRLLWSIDAVTACPHHQCTLLKEHSPRLGGQVQKDVFAPGISRYTGERLSGTTTTQASKLEIACSERIARLLDDATFLADDRAPDNGIQLFLQHAVDTLFHGVAKNFADYLDVGKSQLHGWMHGKRPNLHRLAQISLACDCEISDIVLGNRYHLHKAPRHAFTTPIVSPKRRTGARLKGSARVVEELELLIQDPNVITLRAAANHIEVSEKYLRALAPDLCRQLVERGMQVKNAACRERQRAQQAIFRTEFENLKSEGVYPSRRKVAALVQAKHGLSLGYDECNRALHYAQASQGSHPVPIRTRSESRPACN